MRKHAITRVALVAALIGAALSAPQVRASPPQCYPYNGSGYCQYNGKVSRAYMNAYDQVILYFDGPVDPAQAASVGINGVSVTGAALYNMAANRDFGKALFAALLSAQARGATVEVQMSSVSSGYLVMDRIWVLE
jgi:hypothetical protein